jgi:hypothetical protein
MQISASGTSKVGSASICKKNIIKSNSYYWDVDHFLNMHECVLFNFVYSKTIINVYIYLIGWENGRLKFLNIKRWNNNICQSLAQKCILSHISYKLVKILSVVLSSGQSFCYVYQRRKYSTACEKSALSVEFDLIIED